MSNEVPRVLELFCGIGGAATAMRSTSARVVASVDINELAVGVLQANADHAVHIKEIESLSDDWFEQIDADLWWASPPCQPFTRRGNRRGEADPRASPFLQLIKRIARLRPRMVAIENVPGFETSTVADRLRNTLTACGYDWREALLCPTELGIPNRRLRYYLVASQNRLRDFSSNVELQRDRTLASFVRPLDQTGCSSDELFIDSNLLEQYESAIDVVDANEGDSVASCFTSAYGRSHVRSGSFLRTSNGVRRFAPCEVLDFLGFPIDYSWLENLSIQNKWRLAGNSLSVPAIRYIMQAFDV